MPAPAPTPGAAEFVLELRFLIATVVLALVCWLAVIGAGTVLGWLL